ncbi:hypothetical protein ACIA98_05755 [Streptomyces sp. NPDC051366]|uniref:hypothetical protein n=1 Tax=Streptomyces sp. NPDC051366 TaxID=3365652 RepID=UPI0037A924B0
MSPLLGVPGAAPADTPPSLYVDNVDANCSDAGSGTQAAPANPRRTFRSPLRRLLLDTVPNHVTTPVGDGRVGIVKSYGGSTHVITDLLGCFTQS